MSATQPRAERNRNPANLRPRSHAPVWPGQGGIDNAEPDPPYAEFVTNVDGFAALVLWLLDATINRKLTTATELISVFAPPDDNNPTTSYAHGVAAKVGFGEIELLQGGKANIPVITALVQAICKWESATLWMPTELAAGVSLGLLRWPAFQQEMHPGA